MKCLILQKGRFLEVKLYFSQLKKTQLEICDIIHTVLYKSNTTGQQNETPSWYLEIGSQVHAVTAHPDNKLDRRLSGPQSRSECSGEENKIAAPTRGDTLVILHTTSDIIICNSLTSYRWNEWYMLKTFHMLVLFTLRCSFKKNSAGETLMLCLYHDLILLNEL